MNPKLAVGLGALGLLALGGGVAAAAEGAEPDAGDVPGEGPGDGGPGVVGFLQARWYSAGRREDVSKIILHETSGQGDAAKSARAFHEGTDGEKNPARRTSPHYFIGQDGKVWQVVRLEDTAQHAHDCNAYSVGIEHCAREPGEFGPDDAGLPMTEAQYQASARLVRWLCNRFGLPFDRSTVVGHSDVDTKTTHTSCPQCVLDWATWWRVAAEV